MDMKRFYEEIFNPTFLIRYGYYDFAKIKPRNQEKFLEYGIADAFYSGIFNMDRFTDYLLIDKGINNLKDELCVSNKVFFDTEPIYFTIPKGEYERRQYKMPNLFSYMVLLFLIYEKRDIFIQTFIENNYSTSKFFGHGDIKYDKTKEIRQRLLFGGTQQLHVDLANFYHTLYTHSIPWILLGKKEAKAKKGKKNIFENNLDTVIRNCQYGETYGIPTGNLLSKIIAELYMCYFDKIMKKEGLTYTRYVDDFIFSFTFEEEKVKFLRSFSLICRENNLMLREEKTHVEKFPAEDKMDKTSIFNYFDGMNGNDGYTKWIKKISDFINFCISQEGLGNKGSVKCIFSVLENILKHSSKYNLSDKIIRKIFYTRDEITNFNIFEYILDISLKDSRLTNRFLKFSGTLLNVGGESKKPYKIVKKFFEDHKSSIKDKLNFYTKNNYNQEFYQVLLYSVMFDVKNLLKKTEVLDFLNSNLDDYSLILLVILYLKNKKIQKKESSP